ncbi:glycosyl hydrolase [bacterium]|nr:glycosyl hydrolase [bacterium]
MRIDDHLQPAQLSAGLSQLFELAGPKLARLARRWDPVHGSPVTTVEGQYTSRGWTEWTQGFQYGLLLLQFDATGQEEFFRLGRDFTLRCMAPHLTHTGVHDHGFNNLSTYGHLRRLALEGRSGEGEDAVRLYQLALRVSGAVQAMRWSTLSDGSGFIYSFNGPHSLFADTIRSCRSLVLSHRLGHVLLGENDRRISLLSRAVQHLRNTARYAVYYGEGRDSYDERGRVAHESIFNMNDGRYRCPNTQQGYSPFSTWTRGLAWVMLGAAEELEFLARVDEAELAECGGKAEVLAMLSRMATATCDFYLENTALDGIPYWDTGAPGLARMGDWRGRPAEPDNDHEPVDSSAAAIAAQGLLRLGRYLGGRTEPGRKYLQAGLCVARALLAPPYLSLDPGHEGLLLHTVYHRPNGWDFVPPGKSVPQGESCMWGDYHLMELAVYLQRLLQEGVYLTFWGPEEEA